MGRRGSAARSEKFMNETSKPRTGWRWLRRISIDLTIFATLVAIFYTEENWRGKRAWENCKRELEAKGAVLDWNKYIPPPVPDEQNFFGDPRMAEWFVKQTNGFVGRYTNVWNGIATNSQTTAKITDTNTAASYLFWSDRFTPTFDEVRTALKRPCAIIPGDYSVSYLIPIPNFIIMRSLAQVQAQRAQCHLLLGQPNRAFHELTLIHDVCRILKKPPVGYPETLVEAMINVAITGLYVNTVQDGLRLHAWQEPQLTAIQKQLQDTFLLPPVAEAMRMEQVSLVNIGENLSFRELFTGLAFGYGLQKNWREKLWSYRYDLFPQGWMYQNIKYAVELEQPLLNSIDPANEVIRPKKFDKAHLQLVESFEHWRPFQQLAAIAIPNFTKAFQTCAYNQTLANEAQIVCALERFRLAHGNYPETLDALVPRLIEKLPHDIIGGGPLHFRRTNDGNFLLYSVGWNETDDGGVVAKDKSGNDDRTQGDWVWQYPGK